MERSLLYPLPDLPLELQELIASSLSYCQILALCRDSPNWSALCEDDSFWRHLTTSRFLLDSLPEGETWPSYYRRLENYTYTSRFYLTVEICARAPLSGLEQSYAKYFRYNRSLLKNWTLLMTSPPLIEERRRNSNYCYTLFYEVRPNQKYFTEEDFLQLYRSWIEALEKITPLREKYLNYGTGQGYFIEEVELPTLC